MNYERKGWAYRSGEGQRLRYEMRSIAMAWYSKDKKCEECSPTQLQ